jgi:hypothetical protein
MAEDKRIRTMEQLKEKAKGDDGIDCFIGLNGGVRSSKRIHYFPQDNTFWVLNEIDDSEQDLTEEQLMDSSYTMIGEALLGGALYEYKY